MAPDLFARLTFKGARFQQAAMPLEVLPELAAYRELVLAFAKTLFKLRNPDRQRLPKGFEGSLQLVLMKLEAGSTVTAIARLEAQTQELFAATEESDYFAESRDLIARVIDSEGHSELEADFREAFRRFTGFGRTLSEHESILVGSPRRMANTPYTRDLRRRILLRYETTYEDEVSLVGEVRKADKDIDGFWLRVAGDRRIEVRSPPLFFPVALRSLEGASLVRVRGTGLFDANGQLLRVVMATDVGLEEDDGDPSSEGSGCRASLDHQLDGLLALSAGWYDGEGEAYTEEQIRWLKSLAGGIVSAFELRTPYVYPTPDGAVRFEWSAHREVTLIVRLGDRTAWAMAVEVPSEESEELEVAMGDPGAESRLGSFLARHLSAR